MSVPESLPQRVFLLAYDPERGRVRFGTHLGAMLRAAALADLYIGGQLVDHGGRAVVEHGRAGTARDPFLAAVLEEIGGSKARKWHSWVGRRQGVAVRTVREQLAAGGWVRLERQRVFGVFPVTRMAVRDPRVRKELVRRVGEALKEPVGRVEAGDAALVVMVVAGELGLVVDRKGRRAHKRRVEQLGEVCGPIGRALRRSIAEATAAAAG